MPFEHRPSSKLYRSGANGGAGIVAAVRRRDQAQREADARQQEGGDGRATRLARAGAAVRGLAIDIGPLRESREYRLLWIGELVSLTGRQITVVALPLQVFLLTRSSLAVGMIGLVQVVPLILVSIGGGAVADRLDRRLVIVVTEFGLAGTSLLLLLGAIAGYPPLWYLYGAAAVQSGILAINSPARSASVPNLVKREQLPAALALNQVMFNATLIVGPALAGLVLGAFHPTTMGLKATTPGLKWAYGADVCTFTASIAASLMLRPMPPRREEGEVASAGWQAVREGFAYLKGRRVLISTFLIDLDAMIFGMPRALFPVLALSVFRVGPRGLGLLYAAPAVGAVLGALTAGWVGGIRHQGRAVIWAVVLWGAAIVAFGFSGNLFWLALGFLAFAGAADVISAVFRGTILQLSVPDSLRGRLSAIHIMVVTGGPRLGDFEAGLVAQLVTPMFSVVSGGVVCIAGVALLALLMPELGRYHAGEAIEAGP
jgi:MFS family permease